MNTLVLGDLLFLIKHICSCFLLLSSVFFCRFRLCFFYKILYVFFSWQGLLLISSFISSPCAHATCFLRRCCKDGGQEAPTDPYAENTAASYYRLPAAIRRQRKKEEAELEGAVNSTAVELDVKRRSPTPPPTMRDFLNPKVGEKFFATENEFEREWLTGGEQVRRNNLMQTMAGENELLIWCFVLFLFYFCIFFIQIECLNFWSSVFIQNC